LNYQVLLGHLNRKQALPIYYSEINESTRIVADLIFLTKHAIL